MSDMRYNSGLAFVHPVTHRVVESGAWYEGAAHIASEHEESSAEAVNDEQTDAAQDAATDTFVCEFCSKEYKTEKNLLAHLDKCPQKPEGGQEDQSKGERSADQ